MTMRALILSIAFLAAMPLGAQPRCLTPWLLEQGRHPGNREKAPELSAATLSRETRQRNSVSPRGLFRVHYDVAGFNAVDPFDGNANGVPDYVDSTLFYLDMAWRVEIEEMGYTAPTDKGIQGPEIDVFISELDSAYYGLAYPEFDSEISSDPLRVTGFIVIDNDYVGYKTPGIEGLRVTTAHEFHHIVQFSSYRTGDQYALNEATSTWMEKQVHPAVHDYRYYTDPFLESPEEFPFSTHDVGHSVIGYAHILYLDYLTARFDRDIVRRIWEEYQSEESAFTAIDNVLRGTGVLNLQQSWCEFALRCYYTGSRAPGQVSYLKEAASLPTMSAAQTRSLDAADPLVIQGELQPLAFALERVTLAGANPNLRDTIDFLVTNARSDIGRGGPQLPRDTFTLSIRKEFASDYSPLRRADATVAWYRFQTESSSFCLDPILGGIPNVSLALRTAPQPFVNDGASQMVIAVGTPAEQVRNVRVRIYSASMAAVRQIEQSSLLPLDNSLGVIWDGRDSHGAIAPSGVYIYEISLNGAPPTLGKFAVAGR